jgi:hypothetical protein
MALDKEIKRLSVDNRSATFNINVQGGDPEQVKQAVIKGAKEAGISDKSRAMDQIQMRDTRILGANAQ